MSTMSVRVMLAAVTLLTCGCTDPNELTQLRQSVQQAQNDLTQVKNQLAATQKEVEELKVQLSVDKFMKDLDSVAYLTPGSDGYSFVQSRLGMVTVSLEDVQPYANGSRITLRFGNPMSATLNDVKATLEWGTLNAKGQPDNDSARSREFTFNQSLRAGAWTNVLVTLEAVPPTAFGFVRVKEIGNQGISLMR